MAIQRHYNNTLNYRTHVDVIHTFQVTESSSKETRKQFDKVVTLIKKSKTPVTLVIDTIDRLQRSFRETPILDSLRKKGQLELHFLREGLILDKDANSSKLLQWDIGVLFASGYVRQLSDNVKRSKEQCARNGQWTAKAPFGYNNVTLPDGSKTVEINADLAPLVIKMFELYATGLHSFKSLSDAMNKLGMRTAKGKKVFPRKIEFTLKNPFYCGLMRVKEEIMPHKYETLISKDLFDKVQDVIQGRHKTHKKHGKKELLFRGLIKCGNCGCQVSGDIKKGKYTYYSCSNSKRICKRKWINEKKFLDVVLHHFESIELPDELVQKVVAYLKKAIADEQAFFNRTQQDFRKKLDTVQSRISKLIDMHMDGAIDKETYKIKLKEYKTTQKQLTTQMQDHVDADETCLITAEKVFNLTKQAREIFLSSNFSEKQQFLSFVFSNFTLNGEKLDVELREPFSTMAKLRHCEVWRPQGDSNPCFKDENLVS